MAKRRRWWLIPLVVLSVLILTLVIVAWMADEPLRRYVEGEANSALPGYHVTIGALALHPLTLSIDLRDVVIRQDIHPDPPVLSIAHVTADAELAPLFSGQVGAAVRVDAPAFAITKKHVDGFLRRGDTEVVKEQVEAWQDKIRESIAFQGTFYVTNGDLTYDEGNATVEPLRIERIDVEVTNITNRPEANDEYPSPVRVKVVFPDHSQMDLEGRANLLAIPVPRVEADLKIDRFQVKNLLPVAGRFNPGGTW